MSTIILPLQNVSCMGCAKKIQKTLEALPGVQQANVDTQQAVIKGDAAMSELVEAIQALGYGVADPESLHAETLISKTGTSASEPDNKVSETEVTPPTDQSDGEHIQLLLSGMTCASCVSSVEKALNSVAGVEQVNVNLAERSAYILGSATPEALISAVIDVGYGAELSEDEQTRRQRQQAQNVKTYRTHLRNAIVALAIGVPLMAWGVFGGSMSINSTTSQLSWGGIGVITFILLITAGRHFFVNAYKAFSHHRASMDTLVALGTGSAWLYSIAVVLFPSMFPEQARHVYFEASAMILGLITLGHALEARARSRTSKALERLIDLQPQTAIAVIDGVEKELPLEHVSVGMMLRLRPGAKVPVDGVIEQGESYLDESMLTGEPLPAHKKTGHKLHAGTINQNGSLLFRAERIGSDTMLSRIIQLVRRAQSSKPALARLADKISAIFVPVVMIIATLTAMAWYNFGPQPTMIYMLVTATTVLIIACPCALGLATPMSVTVGVGRAAEFGVLIRDAEALQLAADIDTVVLDKTGTLTEGKPQVTSLFTYHDTDKTDLLSLTASLEQGSEHPLAQAIVKAGQKEAVTQLPQQDFQALPGLGVSGIVGDITVLLGNQRLMQQKGVDTRLAEQEAREIAAQGATPIYVAADQQLIGMLGISDPLRADSVEAVKRLQAMKLNVIMLTGDTQITAEAIAKQAGITTVIAGVLPDGKAEQIVTLQQQGNKVAMVGDGINDAPALAQAEVGIAMGSGSDVAIESGQFTLMRHSLHGAADAIALSKATLRNMKQNLFGAFVYNSLGIPVAAGVLFPLTGTLLSPVVAGAAMALSSITVVSNANRLRLFTPRQTEEKQNG
ncbi:copper-translocating P-type ATPase [Photobacterium lipolyticum]|uniref:Copper-exporting P-type ATPase n=1 Tax=Photobacterium lipolyticum TaxID=266810 RepID=A0A2T3N2S8_9GAMM|nr:copper-translocating P-type ATPase [Photobacterium lipolyticum]PSW06687.1 copper-translocating P-type ATPase [Photobacterium lipolyticum]